MKQEELKWLVTLLLIVPVHILHVPVMVNAVNALHITEEAEKYQDASFQNPAKALMTDQLKICTVTIKTIVKTVAV